MAWFQVVATALVMTTLSLGNCMGHPRDRQFFPSEQNRLKQVVEVEETTMCFPALFSFGGSVADTGTQAIAFSLQITQYPPYGMTFFGKPASRYCDGRVHIDFWATALKMPFLDPYVKGVGSNFRRGANFAAAGARATNETGETPFSLSVQLNQFREFKRNVLELIKQGSSQNGAHYNQVPQEQDFREALYVITIGTTDILKWSLLEGRSLEEVEREVVLLIPQVSNEILRVVEALYAEGARNILVEAVSPNGCSPAAIVTMAEESPDKFDAAGCFKPINDLVQLHNSLLTKGIAELGKRFPDASISVIDAYSIRYDVIANHDQYGFTEPFKSCCGAGGDYNSDVGCGKSIILDDGVVMTASVCDDVSKHIVWDDIHSTEAANRVTMQKILSGKYFEPGFDVVRNGCQLAEI
ncbi:unnamed protein product [Calypogeia fissa]